MHSNLYLSVTGDESIIIHSIRNRRAKLTWRCDNFSRFQSGVFERIFVEDVGDLHVLGGRRRGVRPRRREAEVLFWETVITHLQMEEMSK